MRNVLVLLAAAIVLIPRPSHAQTAALPPAPAQASDDPRIFLDINMFGTAQSLSKSREFRGEFIRFGEPASARASYPKPSRTSFPLLQVGGGVMLTRSFGLGATWARTVYDDAADLAATIPDPEFLRAAKSATGTTGAALERRESAVHVSMVLVPVRTARTQWRVLAGPSFFFYSADMVEDVTYVSDLARPQTAITITGSANAEATANAVGIHIGSDFEYLLTGLIGLTAGARYDDATVTIEREPLSAVTQQIRVGSTRFTFGVRFHLGK